MKHLLLFIIAPCFALQPLLAQTDSAATEEDFSQYENLGFADDGARRFCTSKVLDLSPQKLISLGYDIQGPYTMNLDSFAGSNPVSRKIGNSRGLRFSANIPVISKNALTWTVGANYLEQRFSEKAGGGLPRTPSNSDFLLNGFRSAALNTTVFKPLDDKCFLLFQGQIEVNGDYNLNTLGTAFDDAKSSAALLYGKKVHDRKQWALGAVRTWRAGEINYIPALLLNYTWPSRKYGVEMLFPARAAIRRTFNPRNLLFFGYELEGGSYRIQGAKTYGVNDFELRRSELRFRFTYEHSLHGFIWLSAQAGVRANYSYNVDRGNFFRGFFGEQPFLMQNSLSPAPYFQISLNLVSP
ncbi:MAG: hypothetical protein KJS92_09615 [Bacteroidetes bacterium]|nr:hypothetical protein [Bacteroidota bacterium]